MITATLYNRFAYDSINGGQGGERHRRSGLSWWRLSDFIVKKKKKKKRGGGLMRDGAGRDRVCVESGKRNIRLSDS